MIRILTAGASLGVGFLCLLTTPGHCADSNVAGTRTELRAGALEEIATPLRGRAVEKILVHAGTVWVGGPNGITAYDGGKVYKPMTRSGTSPTVIVKDLVGLTDGSILIGTINGTVWRATADLLEPIVDLGDRSEFDFAQDRAGNIFFTESFNRSLDSDLQRLLSIPNVHRLKLGYQQVEADEKYIYGLTDSGDIERLPIDRLLAGGTPEGDGLEGTRASRLAVAGGSLFLAGDGIKKLDEQGHAEPVLSDDCSVIASSNAAGETRRWFGCRSDIVEIDGQSSHRWLIERSVGEISALAADQDGNLWIGANGLWRLTISSRTVTSGRVASIDLAKDGSVYLSRPTGAIERVDLATLTSQTLFPGHDGVFTGQVAASRDGRAMLAMVSRSGQSELFGSFELRNLTDGSVLGTFPDHSNVLLYAGKDVMWLGSRSDGSIWRIDSGKVAKEPIRSTASGGSGVAAFIEDIDGRLWVAGLDKIYCRLTSGEWITSEPVPYAPETKLNLWGAAWLDKADQVTIFGPWGYAVRASVVANEIHTQGSAAQQAGQPLYATDAIMNPVWGVLLAAHSGLYRFVNDGFVRFSAGDVRLDTPVWSLANTRDGGFLAATDSGLLAVYPPRNPPILEDPSLPGRLLARQLQVHTTTTGLSGGSRRMYYARLSTAAAANAAEEVQQSDSGVFNFTNLDDETDYRLVLTVANSLGVSSAPRTHEFRVALPLVEKSWFWPAIALLGLAILIFAAWSRRLVVLMLRVLGRRQWQLTRAATGFSLEVRRESRAVRINATAPISSAGISFDQTIPMPAAAFADDHSSGVDLWNLLPAPLRFALNELDSRSIQIEVDHELIDWPLELAGDPLERALALRNDTARNVLSDSVATQGRMQSLPRLKALLVAPDYLDGRKLAAQRRELSCIASCLKQSFVEVIELTGNVKADAVLNALQDTHLLHFSGHTRGSEIGLELSGDLISPADIKKCVDGRNLLLAFANACSSGKETAWLQGSAALYGLASPFVQSGAFFIGARWPIEDTFAAEFAEAFYSAFLPAVGVDSWWKWLAGRPMRGETFGASLRLARQKLNRGRATTNAWTSYVGYGDPAVHVEIR